MSWATTFTNFASNWLTPYAWTPAGMPAVIKAIAGYSEEELFPAVNSRFSPFIMDETQHDAYNMAIAAQEPTEWVMRFLFVPFIIGVMGNFILNKTINVAKGILNLLPLPNFSIVPQPIKRVLNPIVNMTQSVFNSKVMKHFIVPEVISSYLHMYGPRLSERYVESRPIITAFMRPFWERILPSLGRGLDDEGFVISLRRMFISKDPGAVSRWIGRIGSTLIGRYNPKNFAEANAPYAFELGEMTIGYLERFLMFLKDIFQSTTQIIPSLSSWENFKEAKANLAKYFEVQLDRLDANWEPIASAAKSWAGASMGALGNMIKSAPSALANLIANVVTEEDSDSWTRTAAQGVGYIPTMLVAVYATYATALAVRAGFRAIRDTIYPSVKGSFKNIIELFVGAPAVPVPLVPPAGLQAHLNALLGHAPAQHNHDWNNIVLLAERQWLNQQLLDNPAQLHTALVGMGIAPGNEAIVNGLAMNP